MSKESRVEFRGYEKGASTTVGNLTVLLGEEPTATEQPLGLHGFCNGKSVRFISEEFTLPATLKLNTLAQIFERVCESADSDPEHANKMVMNQLSR